MPNEILHLVKTDRQHPVLSLLLKDYNSKKISTIGNLMTKTAVFMLGTCINYKPISPSSEFKPLPLFPKYQLHLLCVISSCLHIKLSSYLLYYILPLSQYISRPKNLIL